MNSFIRFFQNKQLLAVAVVISILWAAIIILVWHYFWVGAKSRDAQNTAHNLRNAISAYFTENRKYPAFPSPYDTDLKTDFHLMDTLMGEDYTLTKRKISPRKIAFFAGRRAKRGDDGRYRSGVSRTREGQNELWDSWGNHYFVRFDTNEDGQVADPSGGDTPLAESILVWSAGPDGDFSTWKDNVKTW